MIAGITAVPALVGPIVIAADADKNPDTQENKAERAGMTFALGIESTALLAATAAGAGVPTTVTAAAGTQASRTQASGRAPAKAMPKPKPNSIARWLHVHQLPVHMRSGGQRMSLEETTLILQKVAPGLMKVL